MSLNRSSSVEEEYIVYVIDLWKRGFRNDNVIYKQKLYMTRWGKDDASKWEDVWWCVRRVEVKKWKWGRPVLEWPERSWDSENDYFEYWEEPAIPINYLKEQRKING